MRIPLETSMDQRSINPSRGKLIDEFHIPENQTFEEESLTQ